MAKPGFYNDNAHRRYPLLSGKPFTLAVTENADGTGTQAADSLLADAAVVDFGCIVGLDADYVDARDSIWLSQLHRDGDELRFTFQSDAPGLENWTLQFVRDWSVDGEYLISESVASLPGFVPPFPHCDPDARWAGFLATGDLQTFGAAIPDGYYATPLRSPLIEPSLIQNLRASFVRSINLANRDRTRAEPPLGCEPSSLPFEVPDVWVGETCMVGDLKLQEGYNCRIRQDDRNNAIEISAGVGSGAGQPCEEVLLSPEESSLSATPLTGGPLCRDVLKTINGVGGRVVRLEAGQGVRIGADPVNNTVIVNVDLHNLTVCGLPEESSAGE